MACRGSGVRVPSAPPKAGPPGGRPLFVRGLAPALRRVVGGLGRHPLVSLDGTVDVAVDVVGAEAGHDAVALQRPTHRRLEPGQPQGDLGVLGEVESSAILAEPWESTKLIPSQSSTTGTPGVEWTSSRTRSSRASEVAKKRPPSSRITTMPGTARRPGARSSSRKTCVPASRAEHRHVGPGGHRDQPEEGQPDTDQDAGQHAEDEGSDDRGDGDPEVEPLDARRAAASPGGPSCP